jgi:predicted dehydrogenase
MQEYQDVDRRAFLKTSLGVAAGLGAWQAVRGEQAGVKTEPLFSVAPIKTVRVAFVGVGGMGSAHVRNYMKLEGVEIKAVCDIVPAKVERIQKWCTDAGRPKPTGYSKGNYDFVRLCETEDVDVVFTATPWEWHVPVCLAAMKNGKHAATEVPAAVSLDECWQLVETSEKLQKHCIMMENCCYDYEEMMIFNMVRQGLFGELIHAEGAYNHDLRDIKFASEGEALWRTAHSIKRDGNLYPTHGLGPIAQYMDINRGDQFDYMVSMSSLSRGLNLYAAEKFGATDPRATQKYKLGDVNVSMIRTKAGRTITLVHDCNLPRPYTRINMIQGTKGIAQKWPNQIHIEGKSPKHDWEPLENYKAEYEHPLWRKLREQSSGAGHGGMDFIEDYRFVECLHKGEPLDMDVYDAAAWSCISELSERSVANRSRSMDIPDFTRGRWRTRPQLGIVGL